MSFMERQTYQLKPGQSWEDRDEQSYYQRLEVHQWLDWWMSESAEAFVKLDKARLLLSNPDIRREHATTMVSNAMRRCYNCNANVQELSQVIGEDVMKTKNHRFYNLYPGFEDGYVATRIIAIPEGLRMRDEDYLKEEGKKFFPGMNAENEQILVRDGIHPDNIARIWDALKERAPDANRPTMLESVTHVEGPGDWIIVWMDEGSYRVTCMNAGLTKVLWEK